ncbi:beta-ketoacyl synthase N-terminal-like domain-containing protein [Clostridium cellulovorans]|uniref:6-deoxyerythronolide-B synthase n=1 Tax=Clostridium cellulovorans (strain ATCC 35296 / DSM 3052 / OCM 3 / 743B) TaxID=573061 RepID=D9SRA9_CLOC7|nr:beta-ketoacyl synthase N-terminal-like domain-containing protein [Clostridium cellulovorans]ADL52338.1 6-deoxyerythronolide-B synthase [Clostridium cellulovorans 743B]
MRELYTLILQNTKAGNISKEAAAELLNKIKEKFINNKENDLAIVGMAGRFPEADHLEEFWENLVEGKESIREFPADRRKSVENYIKVFSKSDSERLRIAGYLEEIDKFDNDFFGISPKEAALMDPNQRILLENVVHTVEDAGETFEALQGSNTGVYIGYSTDFGTEYKDMINVVDTLDGFAATGNTYSVLAGRISYLFDWIGPSMVIDTACSSSLVALNKACDDLRNGACNQAIVGSIKAVPILGLQSELEFGVGSSTERTFPFDNRSDGIAFGEGVGCIMIKPLANAIKNNDRIYAVIKGGSVNQDGNSMALTAPNPLSQKKLILQAAKNANVSLADIGYFETHGTGTKLGDPIEVQGITLAFKEQTDKKQFCAIGSVKANIGHLDCAAGIASVIKCALQLKHQTIVPSINFEIPNKNIDFMHSPVYVNYKTCKWRVDPKKTRKCCISSFSVGGTNSHIILEEYQPPQEELFANKQAVKILTLSAKDESVLKQLVKDYKSFLNKNREINLMDLCYTANSCRQSYIYRLAIVFNDLNELLRKLNTYQEVGQVEGVYVGKAERNENNGDVLINQFKTKQMLDEQVACQIAESYTKGNHIDWTLMYADELVRKVTLPLYPFRKNRCWIDLDETTLANHRYVAKQEEKDAFILVGKDTFTKIEVDIARCFYQLLGVKQVDINDCFFELGGNSLLAIKFELEMKKLNYEFSYKDLNKYETVKKIANFIESKNNDTPLMNKVIVYEGIKPFNDIFFRDCFYNSFFPILQRNKKSIMPFMLNAYPIYKLDQQLISVEYDVIQGFEALCKQEHITYETFAKVDDIVGEIESGLSHEQLIIVFIDCYYETFRKDTYNKLHWPHTLLIYGMDVENKKFYVLEHTNKDNLGYKNCTLDYQDVIDSYRGCYENFPNMFKYGLYKFNIENGEPLEDETQVMTEVAAQNILAIYDKVSESNKVLDCFKDYFKKILGSEQNLIENSQNLVTNLNNLINIKRAELYKYEQLPIFKQACNQLKTIINNWEEIRDALFYCLFANEYNNETLLPLNEKLKQVISLECEYTKILYDVSTQITK